jgi:hypothetical protein
MTKKPESYMVYAVIERLMPHTGDWKGDVSLLPNNIMVEVEVPSTMVPVIGNDTVGIVVTPEGLAYINLEVKKALFKAEQEYQAWRVKQLKTKSKGDK